MTIAKVNIEKDMDRLVQLIRSSFVTVAQDLNLTEQNAPTNPAFIKPEDILKSISEKKIGFYGYFRDEELIGCYALENAGDGFFTLNGWLPCHRRDITALEGNWCLMLLTGLSSRAVRKCPLPSLMRTRY